MPSVLFKEGSPDAPKLARLYGIGVTTGLLAYYEKRDGRTFFISLLAQGECDGIEKVYYKGFELSEFNDDGSRNWRFHNGTQSTGFADAVQGRPEFFPNYPTTLNRKAYIEVALSRELSEGEDEPTHLKVIMRGTRMYNYTYNATTGMIEKVGVNKIYSVNPALEFLDVCVEIGGIPLARFHKWGDTWQEYFNRCAELINWQGGNVAVAATYVAAAGISGTGDGALTKTSSTAWGNGQTRTVTAIPANTRGGFSFKVDIGSLACGLHDGTPASDAAFYVAVGFDYDGTAWLWRQGVETSLGGWLPSDEFEFRTDAGVIKLFKNGVEVDTSATPLPAANVALYGAVAIYDQGGKVRRSRLLLTNTARQVSRYTGHFAFDGVDVPTAINALMIRTIGCDWFDANGGIGFFPSPVRPIVWRGTYDPTQSVTKSNQVRGKFNFTVKDDEQLINYYRWAYRNLDDPLLTIAYEYTDRPALRAAPFNAPLNQSEVTPLGVANQSEVQRIGEAHARLFTDLAGKSFYVEGQADSYPVVKGSVIELSHDVAAYRESAPPKFLVTEESFIAGSADDRGFIVVPYVETFYDDAAHGAVQQQVLGDVKSPFEPPPPATLVSLVEAGRALPDGTYMPVIRGTVTFDSTGQYPQRARVWWKKPSDASLRLTEIMLTPNPATYQAGFELEGVTAGAHEVQIITESLTGQRLASNFHAITTLNAVGNITAPAPPASLSMTYDNARREVRSAWSVSSDSTVIAYQLTDDLGNIKFQGLALEYFEPPTSGTMTRRVYTINRAGIRSTTYTQATYTHGGAPAISSLNLALTSTAEAQGSYSHVIKGTVTFATFARNQRARVYVTEPSTAERLTELVLTPDGSNQATFSYLAQATGTYGFRVVTYDDGDFTVSPTGVSNSIAVVALAVPAPSGYAMTFDGLRVRHAWVAPSPRERVASFQVARDSAFTDIIFTGDALEFFETIAVAGSYTRWLRSVGNNGTTFSTSVSTTVNVTAPAAPTVTSAAYDSAANLLRYAWSHADAGVTFEIDNGSGTVLYGNLTARSLDEPVVFGTASYSRRVRAINRAGIVSAWVSLAVTIPTPATPTTGVHTFNGEVIAWRWSAGDSTVLTYYEFDNNAGTLLDTPVAPTLDEPVIFGTTAYTRRVRAVNRAGVASAWLTITHTVAAPAAPSAGTHAYLNDAVIRWRWSAGDSQVLEYFEFDDNAGLVLGRPQATMFEEVPTYGTAGYTRRVRAVNRAGAASAWLTVTYTVPSPSAPTGYTMTFDGERLLHGWSLSANLEYEVASDSAFTARLWRGKGAAFVESGFATSSRALTRYVRAINNAGLASTATSASVTVTAPAAPTVTKDATRQYPTSLVVHLTTAVPRSQVRATVVQVRSTAGAGESFPASVAQGTDRVFRFAGLQTEIDVPYKAGGAMELRVSFEDKFTETLADHLWSTALAHTFPRLLDVDIDPQSNLARQYAQGTPMMSGGGTIAVSAGAVVSWSAGFVVAPLHTSFAPTGRVDISANSGGTLLAVNQVLVARFTLGTSGAPTLNVFDLSTYVRPDQTATTYDFWIAHRRADGKFVMYNGAVLNVGETMLGDTFIPYLTVITAMIANLAVTDAKIATLTAQKIVANVADVRIIFADDVGSRNYVPANSLTPQAEPVALENNVVGATLSATGALTKTAADAWGNSGASSTRSLTGDGYVEFVIPSGNRIFMVGLSYDDPDTNYTSQEYAIYADNNLSQVKVYEENSDKGSFGTPHLAGDKYRVAVESGGTVVRYYKVNSDGTTTLLYTSATAPRLPMLVDVTLYKNGMTLDAPTLYGVLAPTVGEPVRWQNRINTSYTIDGNDDLYKSGGTNAVNDAGATSYDKITGDAFVEYVFSDPTLSRYIGFTELDVVTLNSHFIYSLGLGLAGDMYAVWNGGASFATLAGTAVAGDKLRVAIEGGVFKVRRNGTLLHTGTGIPVPASLRIAGQFYSSLAPLKGVRYGRAGARPQGFNLSDDGTFEVGVKGTIAGYDIEASQARAMKAIAPNLRVRGNDFGTFLVHKVNAVKIGKVKPALDGTDDVYFTLVVQYDAYATDAYANADSIRFCRVRVLDQFGAQVEDFGNAEFSFNGRGVCAQGFHKRAFADPATQAIYELRFWNEYGWSDPVYYQNGVTSVNMPTLINPLETPTGLNVKGGQDADVKGGWRPAVLNPTTQTGRIRKLGAAAWDSAGGLASNAASLTFSDRDEDTWYEFQVLNGTNAGEIKLVKTPAQIPMTLVDVPIPTALVVTAPTTTQIVVNLERNGRVGDLPTSFELWRSVNGAAYTLVGGAAVPYTIGVMQVTDNTVAAGNTYEYKARNVWAGKLSRFGAPVALTIPASAATDPSNLQATARIPTEVGLTFNVNASSGAAITVEWKLDDGTYSSGWSSIATGLTTPTAAYTHTGRAANTRYAYRVKFGASNYSNIAVVTTPPVVTTDPKVKGR